MRTYPSIQGAVSALRRFESNAKSRSLAAAIGKLCLMALSMAAECAASQSSAGIYDNRVRETFWLATVLTPNVWQGL